MDFERQRSNKSWVPDFKISRLQAGIYNCISLPWDLYKQNAKLIKIEDKSLLKHSLILLSNWEDI